MLDQLLNFVAPHHCYSCGKIGFILCDNCKYDIVSEGFSQCIACLKPVSGMNLCKAHSLPYQKAWVVGEREGVLDLVINAYKFDHRQAAHREFASLLDASLPVLPQNTIITAIPTIPRHIRQKGFDHIELVSRLVAKKRGLTYQRTLVRRTNTIQLGASKPDRERQAKEAFTSASALDENRPYVLIDDVFTTGATMYYGAQALQDAGANQIWIGLISRQPIDHKGSI